MYQPNAHGWGRPLRAAAGTQPMPNFRRLDQGPKGRVERPSLHDRPLIVERRSLRFALPSRRRKLPYAIALQQPDGASAAGSFASPPRRCLGGRPPGFVPGGGSRRARPVWQPGNLVEVEWRARLSEQLGNYSGELREPNAARALDDASELAGLAAACAVIDAALPEREPHPAIFDGFRAFLGALGHPGWPAIYVRLELGLLQELGFGLDLEKCAATRLTEALAYCP